MGNHINKTKDEKKNMSANNVEGASFETAIEKTAVGKFNLLLVLVAFVSYLAAAINFASMAYITPAAQCDLHLTLQNKGVLSAITFAGIVSGALVWGYIGDVFGRKKLLVCGHLLDAFFVVLAGFSQHYVMLATSKYITGFVIIGAFTALVPYMNEFHSVQYRSFFPLMKGIAQGTGGMLLPTIGMLVLTKTIRISFFNDAIVLHSWNLYLLICAVPSTLAGCIILFLPESPKFLMVKGENEKALNIFQRVYRCNTGKPTDSYPVISLADERRRHKENDQNGNEEPADKALRQVIEEGLKEMVLLVRPPYLSATILLFLIQFGVMFAANAFAQWAPQMFSAVSDYDILFKNETKNVCKILDIMKSKENQNNETCSMHTEGGSMYRNSLIVESGSLVASVIAIAVVNKIGKKLVLVASGLIAGLCGICLLFAKAEVTIVALSTIFLSLLVVSISAVIGITVDIFPTTVRTTAVSLNMVVGRTGAFAGSFIYPILITAGCLPPFLTLGFISIGGGLLAMLLPKTDKKALE